MEQFLKQQAFSSWNQRLIKTFGATCECVDGKSVENLIPDIMHRRGIGRRAYRGFQFPCQVLCIFTGETKQAALAVHPVSEIARGCQDNRTFTSKCLEKR